MVFLSLHKCISINEIMVWLLNFDTHPSRITKVVKLLTLLSKFYKHRSGIMAAVSNFRLVFFVISYYKYNRKKKAKYLLNESIKALHLLTYIIYIYCSFFYYYLFEFITRFNLFLFYFDNWQYASYF